MTKRTFVLNMTCPNAWISSSVQMEARTFGVYCVAMADLDQAEADSLIAMEKHRIDTATHQFPSPGESLRIPLRSSDGLEAFLIDVQRKGRIKLSKVTYQARARKETVLVRLDIDGPPHRNPDQSEIPCPHLHLYREGFDDRWAFPAPAEFTDTTDLYASCLQFMDYVNVTQQPAINPSLL